MSKSEQEIEVKFLVRDLSLIAARLQALGANLKSERVLETNLRFDTPDGALTRALQVLRLRQDAIARLTFKGPAAAGQSVSSRQEIEFAVSDFQAARHFLEALGYQVSIVYEKYRTEYSLRDLVVTLDEMPYGSFVEIEGPDAESIQQAAADLHLDWEARSIASYLALFNQLRSDRGLKARNLTFAELKGVQVSPQDLGLRFAI
jgi:adenylate cyclase, class 2